MTTVVLLGTLDTKGEEYAFLRDLIIAEGCDVLMVNAGVRADPEYPVDVDRRQVAEAAGADVEALAESGDRGVAVTTMGEGAAAIVVRLFDDGRLHGVAAMGGSGGSSIASAAMRALPFGVPKLLVSTMASGDVGAFVGTADIAMLHSVVDIAGINSVSRVVIRNAASAIAAMSRAFERTGSPGASRPAIGATMYGSTTPCVSRARDWLEDAGYEVITFHATGTGGRSMESLLRSGHLTGVLDVTTTELMDEVAGGSLSAGPDRLEIAGRLGLPQVVSLGGVDQITFTPPSAVPDEFRGRNLYRHNANVVLARPNVEECRRFARVLVEKLGRAQGPTTLFVPLRGTSSYSIEGAVFHDPEANQALVDGIRENAGSDLDVVEVDTDINDPALAVAMAERLDHHYQEWAAGR